MEPFLLCDRYIFIWHTSSIVHRTLALVLRSAPWHCSYFTKRHKMIGLSRRVRPLPLLSFFFGLSCSLHWNHLQPLSQFLVKQWAGRDRRVLPLHTLTKRKRRSFGLFCYMVVFFELFLNFVDCQPRYHYCIQMPESFFSTSVMGVFNKNGTHTIVSFFQVVSGSSNQCSKWVWVSPHALRTVLRLS